MLSHTHARSDRVKRLCRCSLALPPQSPPKENVALVIVVAAVSHERAIDANSSKQSEQLGLYGHAYIHGAITGLTTRSFFGRLVNYGNVLV